jgi:hypothetical protein
MLRGILGIRTRKIFKEDHTYALSTLKENVRLLDEETLVEISAEVVRHGHTLLKKKEEVEAKINLEIKTDTFPVASNVHFPTDMNLLWDSIRKSLDYVLLLLSFCNVSGWRKIEYLKKELKKQYRITSEIHRKKGANYNVRIEKAVGEYIERSKKLSAKINKAMAEFEKAAGLDIKVSVLLPMLKHYVSLLDKHVDLLERRILKEEKIPHDEKMFSIFEEHAEWLTKGKLQGGVVIGHNVLISTDQYHFIVDHKVVEKQSDKKMTIEIGKRLEKKFSEEYCLESISFDRGFYSLLGKEALQKIFRKVILPKPGKKSAKVEQEESEEEYKKTQKKHSTVESNINELRHRGVDRIPDKGLLGFKKYVALGVLAYNLRRLGKILIEQRQLNTIIKPIKQKRQAA